MGSKSHLLDKRNLQLRPTQDQGFQTLPPSLVVCQPLEGGSGVKHLQGIGEMWRWGNRWALIASLLPLATASIGLVEGTRWF